MSQLVPVVNNFVGNNNVPNVGNGVKFYFLIGSVMGADRLNLLTNFDNFIKFTIRAFVLLVNVIFLGAILIRSPQNLFSQLILGFYIIQYYLLVIFVRLYNDTQRSYLVTIRNFDIKYCELGFGSFGQLEIKETAAKLLLISAAMSALIIAHILPLSLSNNKISMSVICILFYRLITITELLLQREYLKILYKRLHALTASLGRIKAESNTRTEVCEERTNAMHNYCFNIKRTKNAYTLIANAWKLLKDSIKWQLATMLVLGFFPRIMGFYLVINIALNQNENWWIICLCSAFSETVTTGLQIMPSILCDQINAKEKTLKAILAKHLCCNSLDKKGRRLARKFMAILDKNDLSFKLFHVADVGMRLPIQFLSLTLTYVIILLQFGKLLEKPLMEIKIKKD